MKKYFLYWIAMTLWLACGASSTNTGGAAGSSHGGGGGSTTLTPTIGGAGGSGATAGAASGGTGGSGGAPTTTGNGGTGNGGMTTGAGGSGGSPGATFLMNVTVNGPGTITSASNPPQVEQISCGNTCSVAYGEGAQVTLMVHANGAMFTGWSGDALGCGTGLLCTFTMISDISATASFMPN